MWKFRVCILVLLSGLSASAHAQLENRDDLSMRFETEAFTWFSSTQFSETGTPFELLSEQSLGGVNAFGLGIGADVIVFPGVNFHAETSVQSVSLSGPSSSVNVFGLSDFYFGGAWLATESAIDIWLGAEVKAPTGYSADLGPFMPTLGNGVFHYEAQVFFGKAFESFSFQFQTGYRLNGSREPRGGGPSLKYNDQIPLNLDLFFRILPELEILLAGSTSFSFFDAGAISSVRFGDPGELATRFSGGLKYSLSDGFGISGTYGFTLSGTNAFAANRLGVALTLDFDLL